MGLKSKGLSKKIGLILKYPDKRPDWLQEWNGWFAVADIQKHLRASSAQMRAALAMDLFKGDGTLRWHLVETAD